MPQLFRPGANALARGSLLVLAVGTAGLLWGLVLAVRSPFETGAGVPVSQPVPFSHAHHAGGLGLDCRYCHTTVETTAHAGFPATEVCMTCHSQLYTASAMLAPVRASQTTGQPLPWQRVARVADFVYFDHSIHVRQGVGCDACHGRVDRMPITYEAQALTMAFCLDCHRDPGPRLRPRAEVFNLAWQPPADQARQGRQLAIHYGIAPAALLTSCSTCHR